MEKIVVNDTNIFIDLLEMDILGSFFALPWEVYTTDFVMLELLREGQRENIEKYNKDILLKIATFDEEEMSNVLDFWQKNKSQTNVSLTDCSVWYFAKKNQYLLLTGDRKLKSASSHTGVEVHGIIYVIDQLVAESILDRQTAIIKLRHLEQSNPRLPKDEIEKRIKQWEKENKKEGGCL